MTDKTTTVPMRDATATQLSKFATEVLGLDARPTLGREKLIAKINEVGHQHDKAESERTITFMAAGQEATSSAAPAPDVTVGAVAVNLDSMSPEDREKVEAELRKDRDSQKVTIMIPRTDEAGGDEMVPVSVNGQAMAIKRGEPQSIRWPFFVALCHAVKFLYEPKGNNKEMDSEPRKIPAYNFTIQEGPAAAHEFMRKALAA